MNSSAIGNIYEDSIDDIINSEAIHKIRKQVSEGQYLEAGCSPDCEKYIQTLGSSPSVSLHIEDNIKHNKIANNNLNSLVESVNNKDEILSSFPVTFDIQPIELCNMDCIMCKQNHSDMTKVDPSIFLKLFSDLEYASCIRFQGGEMFTDKTFYGTALSLKQKLKPFQSITVITNASLMDKKEIFKLIDGSNPVKFMVSIDSPYKKTFSKIRQSKQFDKVWGNLTFLAENQKNNNRSDLVEWNSVLMRSNFYEVKDSINYANKVGVNIRFNPILGNYPTENYFKYNDIRNDNMISYLESALELKNKVDIHVIGLEKIHERLKLLWD